MKVKLRRSVRGQRKRFGQREFSLSSAKTYLGRLLDKAKRGEEVVIYRGSERYLLYEVKPIEPIPMRPHGYFQFDEEDYALDKKLSSADVSPTKEDLD